MRGFPKRLNSYADVQACLRLYQEETKRYLAALYQNRFAVKELNVMEDPTALIYRLGLAKVEVEALIGQQPVIPDEGGEEIGGSGI